MMTQITCVYLCVNSYMPLGVGSWGRGEWGGGPCVGKGPPKCEPNGCVWCSYSRRTGNPHTHNSSSTDTNTRTTTSSSRSTHQRTTAAAHLCNDCDTRLPENACRRWCALAFFASLCVTVNGVGLWHSLVCASSSFLPSQCRLFYYSHYGQICINTLYREPAARSCVM